MSKTLDALRRAEKIYEKKRMGESSYENIESFLVEQGFLLPDKPSIAVLPFFNMSEDPKQEYFSDGITIELFLMEDIHPATSF